MYIPLNYKLSYFENNWAALLSNGIYTFLSCEICITKSNTTALLFLITYCYHQL